MSVLRWINRNAWTVGLVGGTGALLGLLFLTSPIGILFILAAAALGRTLDAGRQARKDP